MAEAEVVQHAEPALILLASFASFFEASFGLNLAFGLIAQVHNAGYNRFHAFKESAFKNWESQLCEPGNPDPELTKEERSRITREWNESEQECKLWLELVVKLARVWANLSAMILLGILGYIGYYPVELVEMRLACWLVVLSTAPTVITFLYLLFYWWLVTRKLKQKIDIQDRVFASVDRILKDKK